MQKIVENACMFICGVSATFGLFAWKQQTGEQLDLQNPQWWVWIIIAVSFSLAEGVIRRR